MQDSPRPQPFDDEDEGPPDDPSAYTKEEEAGMGILVGLFVVGLGAIAAYIAAMQLFSDLLR